ncbi:MAG: polysaccharide pyruvyl transferase family protein [Nitrospira sp.]|nr:polysaccharide pyruvyl transferase family protein [Nitrospira sp.]
MRYFLYGYYGHGNFGDDLLLHALIAGIQQRDCTAEFVVKSHSQVPGLAHLPNVYFSETDRVFEGNSGKLVKGVRHLLALLRLVDNADVFVIGGGSLFIDKGRCNFSLLFLWCAARFAKLRRRRIIIAGVGFDILSNSFSLWLSRGIVASAEFVAIRDAVSLSYLDHLSVPSLRYAADLALADPAIVPASRKGADRKRKVIGICMIDYFRTVDISAKKHDAYLARVAELLRQNQDRFDFCCLAFQEGVGQRDDWMYQVLKGQFPALSYKHLSARADLEFLRDEIDLVVTTRFHLGLLGAMLGKPVAIISHELKLAALALELALPTVFMEEFIEGQGVELVEMLERFDYKELVSKLDRQRVRAERNFDWVIR